MIDEILVRWVQAHKQTKSFSCGLSNLNKIFQSWGTWEDNRREFGMPKRTWS